MPFIQNDNGVLRANAHEGQMRVLQSKKRIVIACAGAQSGKSSVGSFWLFNEIKERGPGTYLICTPTFGLLEKAMLPKFLELFIDILKLGKYVGSPARKFTLSPEGERYLFGSVQKERTFVVFGYAADPNSLEAMTLKGAVLDECGQTEFRFESWQNIYTRRCAVEQARVLLVTTPYSISGGWFKDLCDQAEAGADHIELIRFDSRLNPAFPIESWKEAQREMPPWKFDLFFRGIFTRAPGLIYDSFSSGPPPTGHLIPRFAIPPHWRRFYGADFGSVNLAFVLLAEGQDAYAGKYIAYRTYHGGGLTAANHTARVLQGEPEGVRPVCFGGSSSEDNWRSEFTAAGLRIQKPPISDVEVGINRVWASFHNNQLLVFDDLAPLLTELRTYSRKVDESGNVTEEIDKKSTFHLCFTAGTMVETPVGPVPIENLSPGDLVLTRRGFKPVVCTGLTDPDAEVMTARFSDGRSLTATANHPLYVVGKGFVPIDALEYEDRVVTLQHSRSIQCRAKKSNARLSCSTASHTTGIRTRSIFRIRNISNMAANISTGRYGSFTTAQSLKATTSTTSTRITSTTTSPTLWFSLRQSTNRCITRGSVRQRSGPTSMRYGTLQSPGTLPLKAYCGIGSMARRRGRFACRSRRFAINAGRRLTLCPGATMTGSVPTPVNRHGDGRVALTTKTASVRVAARHSARTNMPALDTVPCHVLDVEPAGRAPVYNLTVGGTPEFFANGVLAHNCDSLRYIMSHLRHQDVQNHILRPMKPRVGGGFA